MSAAVEALLTAQEERYDGIYRVTGGAGPEAGRTPYLDSTRALPTVTMFFISDVYTL